MRRIGIMLVTVLLAGIGLVAAAILVMGTFYEVADEPTALMRAAGQGNIGEVRGLLAAGANVNERRGHSTRFGIFIAHGPNTPTYYDTALLAAIDGGNVEVVRTILEAGGDARVRDSRGQGIWDYAVKSLGGSRSDVVLLLAERYDIPPESVDRILFQVGYIRDAKLLEFALSHANSISAREGALCGAVSLADFEMITRVLQTFEAVPPKSLNCAIGAPLARQRTVVEFLLNRGVDPNGDGASGVHPLSHVLLTMVPGTAAVAVPTDVRELLLLLLRHGSDPRLARDGGSSAIDLARHHGHEAAALLLQSWRPSGETSLEQHR